jgi:hypothetical protein
MNNMHNLVLPEPPPPEPKPPDPPDPLPKPKPPYPGPRLLLSSGCFGLASSGPGAIHLLNGPYDAKLDGAPVLAVTGQTYHDLMGSRYQQEVDLLSLFKEEQL